MKDEIQKLDASEHIRKRPGMYLGAVGSKGVVNLVKGIFLDSIEQLGNEEMFYHFTILGQNEYQISIESKSAFTKTMQNPSTETSSIRENFHFSALKALSRTLNIEILKDHKLLIKWSLDESIYPVTTIDFIHLNEMTTQLAYLHRSSEILITDKTNKYLNQSYQHFPEGIRYIYDRCKIEALGDPKFELEFEGNIDENQYQIFLGYRTDWYPSPQIISFANEIHTICGGSLVDGIMEGLISGCRQYAKESNLKNHKIKKKKFNNGLILVCGIKGKEFTYGGSFKESLMNDEVKRKVKKLMKIKSLEFIRSNEEKANKFLWRFDETQLTSGIM